MSERDKILRDFLAVQERLLSRLAGLSWGVDSGAVIDRCHAEIVQLQGRVDALKEQL